MSTKLGDVCTALFNLWDGAASLDGVNVADGPQANADPTAEWLFVGYDADDLDDSTEGASVEQDWMAFSKTMQEDGKVTNAVVVTSGVVDMPTVRTRALAIVAACETAVRADPTLGGLVMKSHVSDVGFIPMVTSAGCKARVVFTVAYLAQL